MTYLGFLSDAQIGSSVPISIARGGRVQEVTGNIGERASPGEIEMSALLQQLNTEMAHVMEEAKRALVEVRSGAGGAGAGTIWHSDGLVLSPMPIWPGATH